MRLLVYTLLRSMSYAPILFQVKDLLKVHNPGKFHQYSTCGGQVKKLCVPIQHPRNGFFGDVFGPLLPQMWSSFPDVFTRCITLAKKHCLEIFWKIRVFTKKGRTQSLHFWSNLDLPFPPEHGRKKDWAIQIFQIQSSISSTLSEEDAISFCTTWTIFGRKQGKVTSQKVRIKIWQILFHPDNSWSTSCKKIWVPHFPVLRL